MYLDLSQNLQTLINELIDNKISKLPISYPCKVKEVKGVYVKVETLLNPSDLDVDLEIPILQSPYLTLPIKEGDIGLALNCSFLFANVVEDIEIKENLKSQKQNGLFFVPLVKSKDLKNDIKNTTLTSQNLENKITLSDNDLAFEGKALSIETQQDILLKGANVNIQAQQLVEVKGATATLGEVIEELLNMLLQMNSDAVAGNGAPLASPTLISKIPEILAKVKGNFK